MEDASTAAQLRPIGHPHRDAVGLDLEDFDPEMSAEVLATGGSARLQRRQVRGECLRVAVDGSPGQISGDANSATTTPE